MSETPSSSITVVSSAGTVHFREWVAGCCGGFTQVLSGHPLDTIKVKLQTYSSMNGSAQSFSISSLLKNIIQTKGISGLYRGWTSPLIGACILNSVEFGIYNECKQHLKGSSETIIPLYKVAVAGSISGVFGAVITTPTEYLKCNLQVESSHKFRGLLDLTKHLYAQQQQGLNTSILGNNSNYYSRLKSYLKFYKSINRGFGITTFRESGLALYFASYEATIRFLQSSNFGNQTNTPKTWHSLIGGGIGGCTFWTLMFPIDLIKTRIQIESCSNPTFISSWDMAKKIYGENGGRGISNFYSGYKSAIMRAIIVNAAVFATYEKVKQFL